MPRIIPRKEKERWYERFGLGDSVAKLARASHKDPRTVQRGIDEVGDQRATQKAREGLFQDAHRLHQEDLLGSVEQVARSVDSPPRHPDLGFQAAESSGVYDHGPVRVHRKGGAFDVVTIEVVNEFTWELLNEHLGRHEMFRQLDGWKRAFLAAMNAHMALQMEVVTALKDLGFQLSDDLREPGTLRPGGAEVLLRAAGSRILAENPPHGLRVYEGENGEFFIEGDTDLAEGEEFPVRSPNGGRLLSGGKDAQKVVSGVLDSVTSGQAAEAVRETYNKADRATVEARRTLELLRASHYMPGTCGACPRYGRT
jgi:hypothetical protein